MTLSICVLDDNKIVFASHAERHSRKKGDKYLHENQLSKIRDNRDAIVSYYEKPFSKKSKTTLRWSEMEETTFEI